MFVCLFVCTLGSTPTELHPTIRARGVRLCFFNASSLTTISDADPVNQTPSVKKQRSVDILMSNIPNNTMVDGMGAVAFATK